MATCINMCFLYTPPPKLTELDWTIFLYLRRKHEGTMSVPERLYRLYLALCQSLTFAHKVALLISLLRQPNLEARKPLVERINIHASIQLAASCYLRPAFLLENNGCFC